TSSWIGLLYRAEREMRSEDRVAMSPGQMKLKLRLIPFFCRERNPGTYKVTGVSEAPRRRLLGAPLPWAWPHGLIRLLTARSARTSMSHRCKASTRLGFRFHQPQSAIRLRGHRALCGPSDKVARLGRCARTCQLSG